MKQYRHKVTGIVLQKHPVINFYEGKETPWKGVLIPLVIVENSTDYEPANYLFVTEDRVPIFEGDSWFYVVISGNPKVGETNTMNYKGDQTKKKTVKCFKSHILAIKFLEQLKKECLAFSELEENAKAFKLSKTSLQLIKEYLKVK